MYKVLLADDEALIREAIRDHMKWTELGFELCAVCQDGREAIEEIDRTDPDIVLTDICMPYKDGLEVARHVYEKHPHCKVAIISGYDNFEYAKEAIAYKVSAYVLKPVTAKELGNVLSELAKELDREAQVREKQARLQEAFDQNKGIFRERFLSQLVRGSYVHRDVEGRMRQYDVCLAGNYISVVQMKYMNENDPADILLFGLYNVAEELLADREYVQVFQEEGGRTVMIVSGESEYEVEQKIYEMSQHILIQVKQYFSDPIIISAGRCVEDISLIHQSYQNAKMALEYEFLFGKNELIYGREFENKKGQSGSDTEPIAVSEWGSRIIRAVKRGEKEGILEEVGRFFAEVKRIWPKRAKAVMYIQSILLYVSQAATDAGIDEGVLLDKERGLLEEITAGGTMEQMSLLFAEFCTVISAELQRDREDLGKSISRQAVEYIEGNYSDSSLSLNTVSKALAISSSYFSALFKSQTGETFVEALTRVRMERAKQLLTTTGLKSYEVAEQVGYSDAHYFGSTFKKYTGMTPKEYVRRCGQEGGAGE